MRQVWNTLRKYVWWTYERGSVQYDLMVTLILLFIFATPRWAFKDKPVERRPHQSDVVVSYDGERGFIYEIDASAVRGGDDAAVREDLLRVIEPIAGETEISSYQPVRDSKGRITAYRVRVQR
ncbi:MAG TPA: hypothetical protein VK473_07355 [Terriglobales bacterium]|nr:hypothetical protein [Terriglobales bacterium]